MTCKKKRLKCDETKPTCQQCAKRNVECEGYKKDYKWRSFEEMNFNPKPAAKATKKHARSTSFNPNEAALPRPISQTKSEDAQQQQAASSWSPGGLSSAFENARHAFHPPMLEPRDIGQDPESMLPPLDFDFPPDELDPYSLPGTSHSSSLADDGSGNSAGSGDQLSPSLLDMSLPGPDLDPHHDHRPMHSQSFENLLMDNDFDQELLRQPLDQMSTVNPADTSMPYRQPSPVHSDSSTSSKTSSMTILAQPKLDPASPEMLMLRFDKSTCGILSIKDGPTENPWRNVVWPLARDSPALYHAIASMTAFHGRKDYDNLRIPGIYHMRKSLIKLTESINTMRPDAKLATSLVLALGEGWDRSISTGVQHLRGAKAMVIDAVADFQQRLQMGQVSPRDALKWRFLCNTYVYMDVIARLTNLEETTEGLIDDVIMTVNQPMGDQLDVDPLMGCAVSLFALIGRVTHLIQKVRKTERNGLAIISQAEELREQLERWTPPAPGLFERPEDATCEVRHSLQTAEAYRYATLLYLHQAVPEIPSMSCDTLARKVLNFLASVPVSSRTTIIQIFPLLAAGCEVTSDEDQEWVTQRWASMMLRLKIGNVESCWDVTRTIWSRRAEYEAEKAERMMRRFNNRGQGQGQRMHGDDNKEFTPPLLGGKGRARTGDGIHDDDFFDLEHDHGGSGSHAQRPSPLKRRSTFDTMPMPPPHGPNQRSPHAQHGQGQGQGGNGGGNSNTNPNNNNNSNSGNGGGGGSRGTMGRGRPEEELVVDLLEPEYTVRGRLHWLGVMAEWDWEGEFFFFFQLSTS